MNLDVDALEELIEVSNIFKQSMVNFMYLYRKKNNQTKDQIKMNNKKRSNRSLMDI